MRIDDYLSTVFLIKRRSIAKEWILGGKVKLMIHLLSPASRPMQVTQDLENFWNNTYNEVKKELRGKYKKHYWPDDPLTAIATSKTKKHM